MVRVSYRIRPIMSRVICTRTSVLGAGGGSCYVIAAEPISGCARMNAISAVA